MQKINDKASPALNGANAQKRKAARTDDAFWAFAESAEDYLYIVDSRCRYQFANQRYLKRLGIRESRLIGRTYGEFHSQGHSDEFAQKVATVFDTGEIARQEFMSERDGSHFRQTIGPIKDPDGTITGAVVISKDITQYKHAEELIHNRLSASPLTANFIVQDGKFRYINSTAVNFAGSFAEEIVGAYSDVVVHPDDRAFVKRKGREMLQGKASDPYEYRILTKDGQVRWIAQIISPIQYRGKPAILGNAADITERKLAVDQMAAAGRRLQAIIEFLPDPTFVIDEKNEVIAWNRAIEELTGVAKDKVVGHGPRAYAVPFYGAPRTLLIDFVELADEELKNLDYGTIEKKGTVLSVETRISPFRDRGAIFLSERASPFFDVSGTFCGAIETVMDITQMKLAEEKLVYYNTHDELTGLYNRAYFDAERERLALGRQYPISIVAADVDGLKPVNDNQGHAMGDKLLQAAAEVLSRSLRPDDILARMGGDEFSVLLPSTTETAAAAIIERIKRSVDAYNETHHDFVLSISLGASTANKGDRLSAALEQADEAMYREKRAKKGSAR